VPDEENSGRESAARAEKISIATKRPIAIQIDLAALMVYSYQKTQLTSEWAVVFVSILTSRALCSRQLYYGFLNEKFGTTNLPLWQISQLYLIIDSLAKRSKVRIYVFPVKTGIQGFQQLF